MASPKTYTFDTKTGKSIRSIYVVASSFHAAYAKFVKAYPKANVVSVWKSNREETPLVLK